MDVILRANRMGQTRRCMAMARDLLAQMLSIVTPPPGEAPPLTATRIHHDVAAHDIDMTVQTIVLKAEKLALGLTAKRHFATPADANYSKITFDPRFLVFEFTYNLLLRKSQVELINTITNSPDGYKCIITFQFGSHITVGNAYHSFTK